MSQFLFGKSNWLHYRVTTMEAEAIGLLEKGLHYVEFETDCKPVADALSLPTTPHSELGDIISQCKSLIANNSDYVVSFVRR